MDKEKRGFLLVEKEEKEEAIKNIRKYLVEKSSVLEYMAKQLMDNPEKINFSNEPPGFGTPLQYLNESRAPIDWKSYPNIENIAASIKQLRSLKDQLNQINAKLNNPHL